MTGVLQKFNGFFAERRSRRGWLHTAIADQLLNLLVVVPLTLLFLYRSFTLLPDELTRSSIPDGWARHLSAVMHLRYFATSFLSSLAAYTRFMRFSSILPRVFRRDAF